ncbi:hypothetical protein H5410_051958 [Solanum commersonii]|uniref:Uncharacterized protein n=1 Tax=Solanum commersonii TaxID=4109 RepID=A0A9J5WZX0_SOLCO|nr:hypothetical protein H5410_051958 [Solanum commersonii]
MTLPNLRERNPVLTGLNMPKQMFVGHVARLAIILMNVVQKTMKKKINLLNIYDETKGTSDEYSHDEDIDLDYELDASQSGKNCTCTEALFDDEARNHFLLQLKNIILNMDKQKSCQVVEQFTMKQIMSHSDSHSEPSISDLHHEVSGLKEEIRDINS